MATGEEKGLKQRVTRGSEEAIGKLAQELLEHPVISGALSAAFETRERALRAQEIAMSALNLPSASDIERLTRRLRGVSQRLEAIEDALDRLEDRLAALDALGRLERRLVAIEQALAPPQAATARGSRSAATGGRQNPPAGRSRPQQTDSKARDGG
jgi:uncharacterized protein HemY